MEELICPLCGRILDGVVQAHHLVPKTFKGKEKVLFHKICHVTIHSTFTERELQVTYNTIEILRAHPDVKKFIEWVKDKPPVYYSHTKDTRRRYNKRSNRKKNKKI